MLMDDAIRAHASDIREGKLPPTCAILLAIPESYKRVGADERRESSSASMDSSSSTGRDEGSLPLANGSEEQSKDTQQNVPHLMKMEIPAWLKAAGRSEKAIPSLHAKGSMDRPSQTDPIWRITATQKGPIPVTRLSGKVDWIHTPRQRTKRMTPY